MRAARPALRAGLAVTAVAMVVLLTLPRDACAAAVSQDAGTIPLPEEIDAGGTDDVTAELAQFIASVPDGSVVLFPPGGRFRVEGTVEIHGAFGLTLDGNGSTLFASSEGAPHRAHLRLVGGQDLSVQRLRITGANPHGGSSRAFQEALQYQHGLDLRGVSGVTVGEVLVESVYGDCFYVGQAADGTGDWSSDVTIRQSQCRGNGRQGVAITAGERIAVEDNHFSAVGLSAIDLEPNGTQDGARDVVITDNTVAGTGQWFVAVLGEPPVDGITVTGNALMGDSMAMLIDLHGGGRVSKVAVERNISDTAERVNRTNAVIDARRVDGLTVRGNEQPVRPGQRLVRTPDSCDVEVDGNR